MVIPIFRIFDYHKACEFYVGWLGFHIDWEERSDTGPMYMQVSRGDIVLHLIGDWGESCPGSKAVAEINGLLAYHRLLLQKDYPFGRPGLEKTTWSERVMQAEVTDPFGNSIVFIEACV
ncbi:glyoxalase superfamily protein [Hymenobacter montanus]|nr:glyoxalase superfamily protein [Hymenobacter montanus]